MHVKTLNNINIKGLNFLESKGFIINSTQPAEILLVRSKEITNADITSSLEVVARAGAGVNNIPVAELTNKGIPVINTPGANALAVRDLVFGSLICFKRNLLAATAQVELSNSEQIEDLKSKFCGNNLSGKTLAVVGLGAIGKEVACAALTFGLNVVGYDPMISEQQRSVLLSRGIKVLPSMSSLILDADIITVHVPLNEKTKNLINLDLLKICRKPTIVMNFSRAGIVNESDIIEAINTRVIKGHITDFPSKQLIGKKNIMCLPHLGASTYETEEQCSLIAATKAWKYYAYGAISNSVNFPSMSLNQPINSRICIIHQNKPNILGLITSLLGTYSINIDELHNSAKLDLAYTALDISQAIPEQLIAQIRGIAEVIKVRVLG